VVAGKVGALATGDEVPSGCGPCRMHQAEWRRIGMAGLAVGRPHARFVCEALWCAMGLGPSPIDPLRRIDPLRGSILPQAEGAVWEAAALGWRNAPGSSPGFSVLRDLRLDLWGRQGGASGWS